MVELRVSVFVPRGLIAGLRTGPGFMLRRHFRGGR